MSSLYLDEITRVLKVSISERRIFIEQLQNKEIDSRVYDLVFQNKDILNKCYSTPSCIKEFLETHCDVETMNIFEKSSLYKSIALISVSFLERK